MDPTSDGCEDLSEYYFDGDDDPDDAGLPPPPPWDPPPGYEDGHDELSVIEDPPLLLTNLTFPLVSRQGIGKGPPGTSGRRNVSTVDRRTGNSLVFYARRYPGPRGIPKGRYKKRASPYFYRLVEVLFGHLVAYGDMLRSFSESKFLKRG